MWNVFFERASNQVELFSRLFDPVGQPLHRNERMQFLDEIVFKHRSNPDEFPLKLIMDFWCEVWSDYDAKIKSTLNAIFPETSSAGIRE